MAHFRAVMWPILGGTILDAMAVIDWTVQRFELSGPVLAGGVSMGGDAALALAGIDSRVERVAAVAATSDWTRPGMTAIGQPDHPIDQGDPTPTAQWLREHLEPMQHLDAYRRRLDIRCDVGLADTHVPAEALHRFAAALTDDSAEPRIEIVDHPGLDHAEICSSPQILDEAIDWLIGDPGLEYSAQR
jgi:dienelactone hydrolase